MKTMLTLDNYKDILGYENDKINFGDVIRHNYVSDDFITYFQDKISWKIMSKQVLPGYFIRKYSEKLYWPNISYYSALSEDFIREFKDRVDWPNISCGQVLSEDFIREFKDRVEWSDISYNQKLSEDFIRKFFNKVNWNDISYNQILSESFIIEFKDKVKWNWIGSRQKLSVKFIEDNFDRLNLTDIVKCQELSDEFCTKHNVKSNVLKSVFHCGNNKRVIYRTKDEPELINIGCFIGTKDEAIVAISKKYKGKERDDYISKVNECFEYVQNKDNKGLLNKILDFIKRLIKV